MSVVAVWSVMTAQGDTNVAGYRAAGSVSGMAVEGGNHLPPSQCHIPPATHPPTHPTTHTRSQVFYVIACLFVFWLMLRRSPLPPHFAHMRLRLRGQASLLLRQRRAWLASLATTTLDSFGGGFILSSAFDVKASAHNQGSRSGAGYCLCWGQGRLAARRVRSPASPACPTCNWRRPRPFHCLPAD